MKRPVKFRIPNLDEAPIKEVFSIDGNDICIREMNEHGLALTGAEKEQRFFVLYNGYLDNQSNDADFIKKHINDNSLEELHKMLWGYRAQTFGECKRDINKLNEKYNSHIFWIKKYESKLPNFAIRLEEEKTKFEKLKERYNLI